MVAIFSRRKLINTVSFDRILEYKEKIDYLFICVGSKTDLETTAMALIQNFNIVDTYDNHARIHDYLNMINKCAIENKKVALCSMGWDPGLFSYVRALFYLLGCEPFTFWGKGLSQGHTEAIKSLNGVKDAIQFTLPNNHIKRKILCKKYNDFMQKLHYRLCYVVADKQFRYEIKNSIVNMPNYFYGYKTKVVFVNQNKLNKLKTFKHRGEVITLGDAMHFSLKLESNPMFTAKIAIQFSKSMAKLIEKEQFGAYTILDLPLSSIGRQDFAKFL